MIRSIKSNAFFLLIFSLLSFLLLTISPSLKGILWVLFVCAAFIFSYKRYPKLYEQIRSFNPGNIALTIPFIAFFILRFVDRWTYSSTVSALASIVGLTPRHFLFAIGGIIGLFAVYVLMVPATCLGNLFIKIFTPTQNTLSSKNRFENYIIPVLLIFVFTFMFIWFDQIHPLIIYDGDDWTYISFFRTALPSTKQWNPARIFPETFMALPSTLAVHIIMPFTHDYVRSIATSYALAAAIFITVYIYLFTKFIKWLFHMDNTRSTVISLLFLLAHFSIFKNASSDNLYMFSAPNITCFFYYTISALLNGILVFYFAKNNINQQFRSENYLLNSLLILLIYLGIFSNLFPSIIFVVFIGVEMLMTSIKQLFEKKPIKTIIISNTASLLVVIAWLISAWFEAKGSRADALKDDYHLSDSINNLLGWRHTINKPTALLIIFSITIGLFIYFNKMEKKETDQKYISLLINLSFSFLLSLIYIILLTTQTGAKYLLQANAIYALPFFLLLMAVISAAYILKNADKSILILPFIMFVILYSTLSGTHVFKENISRSVSPEKAIAVDNYILEQVLDAASEGKEQVTIKVPWNSSREDNWPHPEWLGKRISKTLQTHGLIDYNIIIDIEVDPSLNDRFNLYY